MYGEGAKIRIVGAFAAHSIPPLFLPVLILISSYLQYPTLSEADPKEAKDEFLLPRSFS